MKSLQAMPWEAPVRQIYQAALHAVDPAQAVHRYLSRTGDILAIADKQYDLRTFRHIYLVGAGKAGAPMAHAAAQILGDRLTDGLVVVKQGYAVPAPTQDPEKVTILEASHPIPDARGVLASSRLVELLGKAGEHDLVICLISGGGSALLTMPVQGISLHDLQTLTAELLACGATIHEINTLRKHLDQIKGGQLARLAAPAQIAALILSDVVGNSLEVIASGPTAPDPTTFQEAVEILFRYDIQSTTPKAIWDHLKRGSRGELSDTPKPGDQLFTRVQNVIIGSNLQAAEAALAEAQSLGFNTLLLTTSLQGEASQAGRMMAAILEQVAATGQPAPRPACLIAGGETTVNVKGEGLGGRNQELALAAVAVLDGLSDVALLTLATDGGDGPTEAAGALVTGETACRARQLGLNPDDYLVRNDSHRFFQALDDLLITGPTRTNVNDLTFLFAF